MKKVNVIRTATFLTLCSVMTGCGVLMSGSSGDGGTLGNSAPINVANVPVDSAPRNISNSTSVNSGMLAINRELIDVLDKEHVLSPVSDSTTSPKTSKNQTQATRSKVSKDVHVVDKVKSKSRSSESAVTVSNGVSFSKKTSSSSYQGMTLAEQSKLDAQAQAQALAKIEYRDTHNPKYDGEDYSKGIFGKYVGTTITSIGQVKSKTVQIKPNQVVHFTFSQTGNDTYTITGGN